MIVLSLILLLSLIICLKSRSNIAANLRLKPDVRNYDAPFITCVAKDETSRIKRKSARFLAVPCINAMSFDLILKANR